MTRAAKLEPDSDVHHLAAFERGELEIQDSAIHDLIRYYTRESGVRSLERELARLARKAVRDESGFKALTEVNALAPELDYAAFPPAVPGVGDAITAYETDGYWMRSRTNTWWMPPVPWRR